MLDKVFYFVLYWEQINKGGTMTPETVKKELPKLMKEFNVSKAYLAEKLGVSFFTVYSWTRGIRKPNQFVIPKLEQIFNGFKRARGK
jgi:DNA-binding transcriptional regulator YiaG